MIRTTSTYAWNDFSNEFALITKSVNPKLIVEFGIGNGYSLLSFVKHSDSSCKIRAFDIFDDFQYSAADHKTISDMFSEYKNVTIGKLNFYEDPKGLIDKSIDILHIDVANDGDTYKFAVENYLPKISEHGVMILEGGSEARDNVDWMDKYNKKKIKPYLDSISGDYIIHTINKFPSITIIKNK
jgi:predicted O-methyltransferase YrrM